MNLYGYGNGDPINNSDPFGLCPSCAAAAAVQVVGLLSGPAFDALNPDGYVVSNPIARVNTVALHLHLVDEWAKPGFEFRVTGGDRYEDPDGQHRSRSTDELIRESSATSPHLESRGARAVDLRIRGVSDATVDAAIRRTQFSPANTSRAYADRHTHVALPPDRRFYRP